MNDNIIRMDSPVIAALRGILLAGGHMSSNYGVAIEHWTYRLSRKELLQLIELFGFWHEMIKSAYQAGGE